MDEKQQDQGEVISAKIIQDIVLGVLVVLFIGFAGMFVAVGGLMIDAYQHKSDSYEELSNQIRSQNAKIDTLTNEIANLKK